MEEYLLSFAAGVAGGLTVYLGAELRMRIRLWLRKQGVKEAVKIINKVSEGPQLPQALKRAKSTYRVVLELDGMVSAVYDDNDSQEAQKVFNANDPIPGQAIILYKNGREHDRKEYVDVGVPGTIHRERIG